MEQEKPKRRALTNKIIPDYDHIFESPETVGKNKNRKPKQKLFRKILRMNARPLISSTLVHLLQSLPTWIVPLLTSNIINIVTKAVAIGGATKELWIELGINAGIMLFTIAQNVPTTVWRSLIVSKMLRRSSAGIKCSVVRKLQSLIGNGRPSSNGCFLTGKQES